MTLPYERTRAVLNARSFLADLMDPKKTPKVPLEIRRTAAHLLKHYPTEYEMDLASAWASQVFGEIDR